MRGTIFVLVKTTTKNHSNRTDLVILSFPPDVYSCHICGTGVNGSYTMAAKPSKTLELRYKMCLYVCLSSDVL